MVNIYEVVLEGFNGASDDTDHLIKWGLADTLEQVKAAFPDASIQQLPFNSTAVDLLDFDLRINKQSCNLEK